MGYQLTDKLVNVQARFSRSRRNVQEAVATGQFPLTAEPALIHPQTTSTVKIRDNGVIDIFVGTDNGIRLDPSTRTISLLGNALHQKVTHENKKVSRDAASEIGGNWTVQVDGNLSFSANGSMTLAAKGDVTVSSSQGSVYILEKGRERFEPL